MVRFQVIGLCRDARPVEPSNPLQAQVTTQDGFDIYLMAISEAELHYGVAITGNGKRRDALAEAIDRILNDDMVGRILTFDSAATGEYATIAATRRAIGRPIAQSDCQIAAIARASGAALTTRNITDL